MNVDPYTDMAQWLDMDARTEAMMRHPAGKNLMSDDERQARQDGEAIQLANSGRAEAAPRRRRWLEIVAPAFVSVTVATFLFLDVFVINGPAIA